MAVYVGSFIPLMTSTIDEGTYDNKLHKATLASIGLGLGEALGGIMHGQLQDRLGTKVTLYINLCELILAFGVVLWFTWNYQFEMWSATLMNVLWGF